MQTHNFITPRFIRLGHAPHYLGVKKDWFNEHVRPHIVEIKCAKNLVLFDRLDLDAWADHYKERNGRLGKGSEGKLCRLGYKKEATLRIGKSLALDTDKRYDNLLKLNPKKKPKKFS